MYISAFIVYIYLHPFILNPLLLFIENEKMPNNRKRQLKNRKISTVKAIGLTFLFALSLGAGYLYLKQIYANTSVTDVGVGTFSVTITSTGHIVYPDDQPSMDKNRNSDDLDPKTSASDFGLPYKEILNTYW